MSVDLTPVRSAIDADLPRLCHSLGMRPDGNRFYCPHCQSDGGHHKDGDFSIERGLVCHKCRWKGDGLALIQAVRGCDFPAAVAFARGVYGIHGPDKVLACGLKRSELSKDPDGKKSETKKKAGGKTHKTIDAAARAALWVVEKQTERKHQLTRTDVYGDPDGADLIEWRFEDEDGRKTFRTARAVAGGYKMGDGPGKLPLLNKAALMDSTDVVFVCEGPKACEAGTSIGLLATTSAHGAKSPQKTDWTPLSGREVVILPDNDSAGRGYAETVAGLVTAAGAKSVRLVTLPDLPGKGDLFDFIEASDGIDPEAIRAEIEALVAEAEEWVAPAKVDQPNLPDGVIDPIEAARSGMPYAMTDLGNAERLVAYHGDSIRWDVARKCWRFWDGKRWAADSALRVHALAADTARRIRKEAAAAPRGDGKNDLGLALFGWAVKSESRERLNAMLDVCKSQSGIAVAADQLDKDVWALNVNNGTIDLKTGTLRPHNRADLITKLAPTDYVPGTRCERFERFLSDSTGNDAEVIQYIQRLVGYTLTGDTSEEILVMVYGPENSGKTTILESARSIMGEYARVIKPDMLTRQKDSGGGGAASPELACLAGARLAAGSELEEGRQLAEALVKNLTGGEPITARHLYAEMFDFMPQFTLWLAVNHCPKVSADDGAIWRRIVRIGFPHTIPPERRDKSLKPYLRDPSGGGRAVLAWAVEGCLMWQRDGLVIPEAVARSTAAYRAESDPLATFTEDCLTFTPHAWTPWAAIWEAYCEHADDEGIKERFRVAPKRLQERLRKHGCSSEKRFVGRGWVGVELSETHYGTEKDTKSADCETKHGGHGGYGTNSETFSSNSPREKVLEKPSYPPCPPCGTENPPADLTAEDEQSELREGVL